MDDRELLEQASLVAELDVVRRLPQLVSEGPSSDYLMSVSSVVKGDFRYSSLVVRLPGGQASDGFELHVPGIPRFEPEQKVLLFLLENADGSFGVLHLSLGAFFKTKDDPHPLAQRSFDESSLRGPDLIATEDLSRDYELFRAWLSDTDRGVVREADYFRESQSGFEARYELFVSRGLNVRWFAFDAGRTVGWRMNPTGSLSTLNQFRTALRSWTRSPARLGYAGTTGSRAGFKSRDGINAIIFGDPNNQMPGRFNCAQGGVLGTGGWKSAGSSREFGNRRFFDIVEGDIVINDGVECLLTRNSTVAAELYTHELGHTLGIAHSSVRAATMFGVIHNDGRGGSLHGDDLAAFRALYGGSGAAPPGGPPPPPPDTGSPSAKLEQPTNLAGAATSGKRINLTWDDNSTGEGAYEVFIKVPKIEWSLYMMLPANSTAVSARELDKGTNYRFKVRALQGTKTSPWSELVLVKTLGRAVPEDPSDLSAADVMATQARLAWKDNSDSEKSFVVWQKIGEGEWTVRHKTPANATEVTLAVQPGTGYSFRVRAKNGNKQSGFSNVVTVTTPAG